MRGKRIIVCVNLRASVGQPSCARKGSQGILDAIAAESQARELETPVETTYCLGFCTRGPVARFAPGGPIYTELTPDGVSDMLNAFIDWQPIPRPDRRSRPERE